MSDDYNPYKAPDSDVSSLGKTDAILSGDKKYTNAMLEHLRNTKPWVRLISVIIFVSVGFLFLAGIGMIFSGSFIGSRLPGTAGISVVGGMVYIGLAVVYIIPGVFLHRYASSLRDLVSMGKTQFMEDALMHQKSYWKFTGIFTLVMLIVVVLTVIIMMVVTVGTAASRF